MDAGLSRAGIVQPNDPHDWNSFDHYRTIHEKRLAEHPFVDETRQDTLEFTMHEFEGVVFMSQVGQVYCRHGVILEVEKWFETREVGTLLQIRCFSYRYVAWTQGGSSILRYHNLHDDDNEYIHRVFNPQDGSQVLYETLTREQFPLFTDVLDEAEYLTQALD